jgi:exosortase/archaeosortase family protein
MVQDSIYTFCIGGNEFRLIRECLGMNSIAAMAVLVVVYAVVYRLSVAAAMRLLFFAIALAILQNVLRIGVILAVSLISFDFAMRTVHDFCGYITFALAVFIVFLIGDKLR